VLEVGCGPGALAREIARRVGPGGAVLGIDRSANAIALAEAGSVGVTGLSYRVAPVERFRLDEADAPFDLAVAVRVGALDGRHPAARAPALRAIAAALRPGGRLFLDGGAPLVEVPLPAPEGSFPA
jgi:SAM-dependent methyltransferase